MTQRLQVLERIRATLCAWHDVVDVGGGDSPVITRVITEGVRAEGMTSELHPAKLPPSMAIAAGRRTPASLVILVTAHSFVRCAVARA